MKLSKIVYSILIFMMLTVISLLFVNLLKGTDSIVKVRAIDETYIITVNKTSTVSVYLSGANVNKLLENQYQQRYEVKANSLVTLRAINESKIFDSWSINGNTHYANPYTFMVTSDLDVSVNRHDPTILDTGKYMGNRFLIQSYYDLYSLEKAFLYGNNINQTALTNVLYVKNNQNISLLNLYDDYFQDDSTWISYSVAEKVMAINNTYFEKLQYGYYLVTQSFACFDVTGATYLSGIGNRSYPFKGVLDGLNQTDTATLFIVSTINQNDLSENYIGLFGYIDEAVIRNINLDVSIAIVKSANPAVGGQHYYVGGIAGYNKDAYLLNIQTSSRFSIDLKGSTNPNYLYVGGLFGIIEGAIEKNNNIEYIQKDFTWNIQTNSSNDQLFIGLISGKAINTYINEALLDVSGLKIEVFCEAINGNLGSLNVGLLIGSIETNNDATEQHELIIQNIKIYGNHVFMINASLNRGSAYVGGLVGYIKDQRSITLGKIDFNIKSDLESIIRATTMGLNSEANLYSGGLVGFIEGQNVTTNADFRNGIVEGVIEDKIYYRYNYLFNGNYLIEAINHGKTSRTIGLIASGGLVGRGYIDINGKINEPTNLLITKDSDTFKVYATQSTTTQSSENYNVLNHASAALLFGYYKTSGSSLPNLNVSNINVLAEGFTVIATRGIDSTALGNIHASGFVGFSEGDSFSNINLYFEDGMIRVDSLSYAGRLNASGNSAYCGGFIGEINSGSIDNVSLKGFAISDSASNTFGFIEKGTTLKMVSIQNTQPGTSDLYGENYCGGIIGYLATSNVNNLTYHGTINNSYIQMQGHQSPDSAFCGGVIGYINAFGDAAAVSISNCSVYDATIYGSATNTNTAINNPDIYVGGIIGAWYSRNTRSINISNCLVYNSNILAVGNNLIEVFCSGIIAYLGWGTNSRPVISDCYVVKSSIKAISNGQDASTSGKNYAYAAGILANNTSNTTTINNCAVIDSNVSANSTMVRAEAYGIGFRFSGSVVVNNCYTNSSIKAEGPSEATSIINPITNGTLYSSGNNASYYVINNLEVDYGTINLNNAVGIEFANTLVAPNTLTDLFPNSLYQNHKYQNKYYLVVDSSNYFDAINANNAVGGIITTDEHVSDLVYVFINCKSQGNTTNPEDLVLTENLNDNSIILASEGWFLLGTLIVYNGLCDNIGGLEDAIITYPTESKEYIYNEINDSFDNLFYPFDSLFNDDYSNIGYQETDLNSSFLIKNNGYILYDLETTIKQENLNVIMLRSTSSQYKYSIQFYNPNNTANYKWYNSYNYYASGQYYYYPIVRDNVYSRFRVYVYTSTQQQAQTTSYYARSNIYYNTSSNNQVMFNASNRNFTFNTNYTTYNTSAILSKICSSISFNINTLNPELLKISYSKSNDINNLNLVEIPFTYTGNNISLTLENDYTYLMIENQQVNTISIINRLNISYDYNDIINVLVYSSNNTYVNYSFIDDSGSLNYDYFNGGTTNIAPQASNNYSIQNGAINLNNAENTINVLKQIEIFVRDDIGNVKITFSLPSSYSYVSPVFLNNHYQISNDYLNFLKSNYQSVITSTNKRIYSLEINPELDITNNGVFYVVFKVGNSDEYMPYSYKLIFYHNKYHLEDVQYAEYTPPLNYQDPNIIGTLNNPYLLKASSTTKLIPILSRINDAPIAFISKTFTSGEHFDPTLNYYTLNAEGRFIKNEDLEPTENLTYYYFLYPLYDLETNVDKVNYLLVNSNHGTLKSNGEFITTSNITNLNSVYEIIVSLKEDNNETVSIYYRLVENFNVTYMAIGADVNGLLFVTNSTFYQLDINLQNGFGGEVREFSIQVGNVSYDETDILLNGWLFDENNEVIIDYDIAYKYYKLIIPSNYLHDDLFISIVFEQIFTISFNLQCLDFITDFSSDEVLTYEVIKGTNFHTFFDQTKLEEINNFTNTVLNHLTGFLHTGYFLITNANNIISYTASFEDILASSIEINSSYIFYSRWSFLVELVMAPGTHIQTAFADDFTIEYDDNNVVNNSILIPINNNNGYMFEVTTDSNFNGEVSVSAYLFHQGELKEIELRKYNNSNVYQIPKEEITGYIIITTSVSNSHIIVGKTTALVMDEILPMDGVYTFKYVVNHYNLENDKSYIFTNDNLDKIKDLQIRFSLEVYDYLNNEFSYIDEQLPIDTIIEIYYLLYVDDLVETQMIGTYQVTESISSLHLKDFQEWNYHNPAYTDITFRELLGNNLNLSEVYYIVVTPPNGYDTQDSLDNRSIVNRKMSVAYVEWSEEDNDYIPLVGERNQQEFNIIELNGEHLDIVNEVISLETSLEEARFSVTPSRKTTLTENANIYTFSDLLDYSFISLNYQNCEVLPNLGYVKLHDDLENGRSVITSSFFSQGFMGIELMLGYNIGDIRILGSLNSIDFEEVAIISTEDIDYQLYFVKFDSPYYYFRIENISLSDIYLKNITFISAYSLIEYNIKISDYQYKDIIYEDLNEVTYQSTNRIVGDVRHLGKTFMMNVNFSDNNEIVTDLLLTEDLYLLVSYLDEDNLLKTMKVYPIHQSVAGKSSLYFNLSKILLDLGLDTVEFEIITTLDINHTLLIEATSIYKPALSEVRNIL